MDEIENLKLVKNQTCLDVVFTSIVKAVGYGFGSIPLLPYLIRNGWKPNERAFSQQSINYKENDEIIYRSDDEGRKKDPVIDGIQTLNQLIIESAQRFPRRRCLGRRQFLSKYEDVDPSNNKPLIKYEFGDFRWKSYQTVFEEFECLCRWFIDIGVQKGNKIAIFANTSPEWITIALAILNIDAIVVTVYPSLPDEAITYAFSLTEIIGVIVDEQTLPRFSKLCRDIPSIKFALICPYIESERVEDWVEKCNNISLYHYEKKSMYLSQTDAHSRQPSDTNALAIIMFTSGSTGTPKGVMISHRNILSVINAFSTYDWIKNHVYAAFLPSSHVFELFIQMCHIGSASCIGFCFVRTLFDTSPSLKSGTRGDIPTLNPTMCIAVPLLIERVMDGVHDNLAKKSRLKRLLFETCYNIKMYYRKYGFETPILDKLVFNQIKIVFGTNLRLVYIGGAYISPETQEFANICFGNFRQGYGLTETSGAVLFTNYGYMRTGIAGMPTPYMEIKLLPWIEGNCDPNKPTRPRGEISISGDCVTLGYYKNEELTNSVYWVDEKTKKRWFRTGDIAEVQPDGTMKIVDRKKDIIKLVHGEYVSLVKIESAISQCPLTDMICVCPNKSFDSLIGLIIPNRPRALEYLIGQGLAKNNDDIDELIKRDDIRTAISKYINAYPDLNLTRYEMPKCFHVLSDIWTPESNLITPTAKIKRNEIANHYSQLLV